MTDGQNEDIPYEVSEHATPDPEDKTDDVDQPNRSVLEELSEVIAKDIADHNSFDVVNLPANATPEQKIAVFDEIAIHKGLAMNLRKYKSIVDEKVKELK